MFWIVEIQQVCTKERSAFGHLCFGLTEYVIKLDTTEQTSEI